MELIAFSLEVEPRYDQAYHFPESLALVQFSILLEQNDEDIRFPEEVTLVSFSVLLEQATPTIARRRRNVYKNCKAY